MEAALAAIVTQLVLSLGEDTAVFLTAFIVGFVKLRVEKGGKGLVLLTLLPWWLKAADEQRHPDGSVYTNDEKHAYVRGVITSWASGLGLDIEHSFQDACIKIGLMARLAGAGKEVVQVVSTAAGSAVSHALHDVGHAG